MVVSTESSTQRPFPVTGISVVVGEVEAQQSEQLDWFEHGASFSLVSDGFPG